LGVSVWADKSAAAIAARQLGVLSRDQARGAGLSERQINHRLTSGGWERLYPTVFRLQGTSRSWRQRLYAVSLWAGAGFAFSHRCAAALHGFDRFSSERVELVTTRRVRLEAPAVVHRVSALSWRDVVSVESFRVTSATRTLLDLAASETPEDLKAGLDQALRRKWTTLERLEVALQSRQGKGLSTLREWVDEYRGGDGPSESELESRVLELFEAAMLPQPQRQRAIKVAGKLRRLDFNIPGTPLIIEADGYAHHSSSKAFEDDRSRDNALVARGYVVLRWTWKALLERPDELVQEVLQATARHTRQPAAFC